MLYSVYVHTNRYNGKKYVGITSKKPEERWDYGCGYYLNKHFYNAIKKYGWKDGFEHEVVATGLTAEEAAEREKELINLYHSNVKEYGYSHTIGGFGYDGVNKECKYYMKGLPKYNDVLNNLTAKALFDELLSIAKGGRYLTETKEIISNGKVISKIKRTIKTEPNIKAIDTIILNYSNEPDLRETINDLLKIREKNQRKRGVNHGRR